MSQPDNFPDTPSNIHEQLLKEFDLPQYQFAPSGDVLDDTDALLNMIDEHLNIFPPETVNDPEYAHAIEQMMYYMSNSQNYEQWFQANLFERYNILRSMYKGEPTPHIQTTIVALLRQANKIDRIRWYCELNGTTLDNVVGQLRNMDEESKIAHMSTSSIGRQAPHLAIGFTPISVRFSLPREEYEAFISATRLPGERVDISQRIEQESGGLCFEDTIPVEVIRTNAHSLEVVTTHENAHSFLRTVMFKDREGKAIYSKYISMIDEAIAYLSGDSQVYSLQSVGSNVDVDPVLAEQRALLYQILQPILLQNGIRQDGGIGALLGILTPSNGNQFVERISFGKLVSEILQRFPESQRAYNEMHAAERRATRTFGAYVHVSRAHRYLRNIALPIELLTIFPTASREGIFANRAYDFAIDEIAQRAPVEALLSLIEGNLHVIDGNVPVTRALVRVFERVITMVPPDIQLLRSAYLRLQDQFTYGTSKSRRGEVIARFGMYLSRIERAISSDVIYDTTDLDVREHAVDYLLIAQHFYEQHDEARARTLLLQLHESGQMFDDYMYMDKCVMLCRSLGMNDKAQGFIDRFPADQAVIRRGYCVARWYTLIGRQGQMLNTAYSTLRQIVKPR